VGHALSIGRAHALRLAETSKPFGLRYVKAFKAWTAEHFPDMAKNTKAWSLVLFDKYAEVSEWWKTVPPYQQRRLLAPQSILNAHRAATAPPRPIDLKRNALSGFRKFMSAFKRMSEADAAALLAELRDELMPLVMQ
jgi:hypothetical protein